MKMDVLSIGVIGPFGRGLSRLSEAIADPVPPPGTITLPQGGTMVPVRRVEDSVLQDPVLNPARRAGRFIKMAMLAAADALKAPAASAIPRDALGLVLTTGMGAHDVNFSFVDGLLDFGMNQGSPSLFSHSVHNAATSYIATMSGSHGPALTLTHFISPLQQGLEAAGLCLASGACEHVLLCAVDELSAYMLAIHAARGSIAADGVLQARELRAPIRIVPGEGAVAILLGNANAAPQRLAQICLPPDAASPEASVMLDHDGLWSQDARLPDAFPAESALCFNDRWGSFPCGTALSVAAALTCLAPATRPTIRVHTHRRGATGFEISL
jgi:3-oxoacyl-[acyl-carrier-protein] synthase II